MYSSTGVGIYIPNPLVDLPNWMSSLTGVGIYIPNPLVDLPNWMYSFNGGGIYIPNPLVDLPNWMSSLTGVGIYIPNPLVDLPNWMSSLTGVGIYIPNPLVDLPNWMLSLKGVGIYIPSKSLRSCVGELGGLRVTIYHTTIVWYLGMGRVNTTQKTRCLTKMADRFCGCCCQWHWHSIDSPPPEGRYCSQFVVFISFV